MLNAEAFWATLKRTKCTFFSGVPCSLLQSLLDYCFQDHYFTYTPAVREDVALGIASAAFMNGGRGGVLMQNSGLGNIVNPLTSFNLVYRVPALLVISWRGYQGKDAPEHLVMGAKTTDLLQLLEVPHLVLAPDNLSEAVELTERGFGQRTPVAIVIPPGVVR